MSLYLAFSIDGEKQLSRILITMTERVKDWTPAFKETAMTLKSLFSQDVFNSEGGAIDERWDPLSPAYAARKNKKYPGKGILEATGTMRNGFQMLWRPDMAQVWNEVAYFKYHQSNEPRSRLPRRVMMKITKAEATEITRIFNTYFSKIVNG